MPILEVQDLHVSFGKAHILRGVSFELTAGETLGVVGESGCGKSMTGFSIMGMLPRPGKATGSIKLEGKELIGLRERDMRSIRGAEIALVMQDPFTSLNPMMRVGDQIAEALMLHQAKSKSQARQEAVRLLKEVGVPIPEQSARKYPHQMSGGQRQRVVLAIAFACRPKVLIADEPTTALDVTLQAQILRLIRDLKHQYKTAVMLVSHDIGVIGSLASEVAVFYAGQIVEKGRAESVLKSPSHPYTKALLAALPKQGATELVSLSGQPPDLSKPIDGCAFAPRCPVICSRWKEAPNLIVASEGQSAACWRIEDPSLEQVSYSTHR